MKPLNFQEGSVKLWLYNDKHCASFLVVPVAWSNLFKVILPYYFCSYYSLIIFLDMSLLFGDISFLIVDPFLWLIPCYQTRHLTALYNALYCVVCWRWASYFYYEKIYFTLIIHGFTISFAFRKLHGFY